MQEFLLRALELARLRQGFCAPNPAVGAVVVSHERVVGEGYHYACGAPHAEVMALQQAGEHARGATVYVTLEPCCHTGRTPPCTEALIAAGVARVVFAYQDPNPKVAGGGQARLLAAGIDCDHCPVAAIDTFYAPYRYWQAHQRPWVHLKLALSLDGKIAGVDGQPYAITGPELALFTHQQRKQMDALLTTVKTIMRDDPQLNVRLPEGHWQKPLYILDRQLQLPLTASVLSTTASLTVLHAADADASRRQALLARGIDCIAVDSHEHGLDLTQVLAVIGQQGHHQLWVEVGGHCFQAWLKQQLAHHVYLYISPQWLGAQATTAITQAFTPITPDARVHWQAFGNDALCSIQYGHAMTTV